MSTRERWGHQPITLKTTGGPRQVQASTYGPWAVHVPLSGGDALMLAWCVTHVPTGLSVGNGFSKPAARKLCQQLRRIVGDRSITGAGLAGLPAYVADQVRAAVLDAHGISHAAPPVGPGHGGGREP